MGDRRNLLGASAVLAGLGSALIAAAGVAAADTGDTSTASADSPAAASANSASGSPTPARATTQQRATARSGPASVSDDDSPAPSASAPRAGRTGVGSDRSRRIRQPGGSLASPFADVRAATPVEQAAAQPAPAGVGLPDAIVAETAEPPGPSIDATDSAARTAIADVAPRGATVTSGPAVPAPASAAPAPSPAPAPAAVLLAGALAGFGGQPGGGVLAATPALAAFTGQRASVAPAAVIGAPLTSAAPPDPQQAQLPGLPTNGVTGVEVGHSRLAIPGAFIGDTVAADWYFPTQADGSVDAQGVIWLQHGFGATKDFYGNLATRLARETNSIVVAPTLSSIPFTFSGGCLSCASSQQAAAEAFLDPGRTVLTDSAVAAGYTGDLSELQDRFVMSGHSAGGGFATAAAADYIAGGTDVQDADLLGVVMFDGVSNGAFDGTFVDQLAVLDPLAIPVYQIAAPAQMWNAFGATTNQLLAARPGQFDGAVLVGGSHVDSMLGNNPIVDFVLQLVTRKSPAGNTAATQTLSTGWINDFYAGATPDNPQYGFYAAANQQTIMGNAAAVGLPTPFANQLAPLDAVLKSVTDFVFTLIGIPPTPEVNTGSNGIVALVTPPMSNGVTGVKTGSSILTIPSGNGYDARADWYFPTQADGAVAANGVIWLQHGFLGFKAWYADLATRLAQETNSVVVVPQIFWFDDAFSGDAAAEMFVGDRPALNISANTAGYQGLLPEKFVLTGHSAGGNFATVAGAGTVDNGSGVDLLGVVMFDGVSFEDVFGPALTTLTDAGIPDYQIAAPPQSWNAWGQTTEALSALLPGQFVGVQIDNGSHADSMGGQSFFAWLGDLAADILVKPSPPGAKAAVGTFASGWVNDLYSGIYGPANPGYGIYGNPNDGNYVPNQPIVMGQAGATTLPAPPPVDVAQYSGTWYEQGSVKQFFSIGLVNTKAVYTPQPDGTIRVENSGNYFGPNGPESSITGSADPINADNTRLNVGFFFGMPNSREPGNYWILDYAPDYSWAIVSDPSGRSGYILTRDQQISEAEYDALLGRAEQLGVRGRITPTQQFP